MPRNPKHVINVFVYYTSLKWPLDFLRYSVCPRCLIVSVFCFCIFICKIINEPKVVAYRRIGHAFCPHRKTWNNNRTQNQQHSLFCIRMQMCASVPLPIWIFGTKMAQCRLTASKIYIHLCLGDRMSRATDAAGRWNNRFILKTFKSRWVRISILSTVDCRISINSIFFDTNGVTARGLSTLLIFFFQFFCKIDFSVEWWPIESIRDNAELLRFANTVQWRSFTAGFKSILLAFD